MIPITVGALAALAWLAWPVCARHDVVNADRLWQLSVPPSAAATSDLSPTEQPKASLLDLADAASLLALALRGGVGVTEAVESVGRRVGGRIGGHLLTVAAAQRWGVDESAAWSSVPTAWQPVERAMRMANLAGVPPAELLLAAAGDIRRSEAARLEVATATLSVRIVLPLGLLFLPAFVLTTVLPVVVALASNVLSGA